MPKEILYVADRRIVGDPSILLIKPVQAAGSNLEGEAVIFQRYVVRLQREP